MLGAGGGVGARSFEDLVVRAARDLGDLEGDCLGAVGAAVGVFSDVVGTGAVGVGGVTGVVKVAGAASEVAALSVL